jgi:hypothetical protein
MFQGKGISMAIRIATVVAAFTLAACATTLSTDARRIIPADEKMVAGCTFVGDVQGSSGWGNAVATTGMENAKNEALEKAAAFGATHILWTNVTGGYSPYAHGRAYKCN